MIKPLGRLGLVVGAVASAVWLTPASVAIVGWHQGGPTRVAYLQPLSTLSEILAAVATITAAAVYLLRSRGRTIDECSLLIWPLASLLLWLIPFLPWIADRAPALLVLAGPVRWVIVAVAVGAIGTRARAWKPVFRNIRFDRRAAFAAALVVYAAMGLRFASQVGFNGDEPHYLIIAQSLLADRDLDIANNHERRDYAAFFAGTLGPDFLRRGRHEEIYSIHAPGLAAILLPAYALAGPSGAVVFMALLAAAASAFVFTLAERIAGKAVAIATWIAVCFSVPFIPHAWLIYPELPAALIVAVAVLRLWTPPSDSIGRAIVYGALLAVLPWLHTKFIVLLALFSAFEAVRLWPRRNHLLAVAAPIAVSTALWLLSFYLMYGVWDPQAPYGSSAQTLVLTANLPRSVLGLLFDQKFGLLVFSPLYVLTLPGAWFLARDADNRWRTVAVVAALVVFAASTARFYMWWGGSSAPARFLVPTIPLLAPLVAAAIAHLTRPMGRALTASLVLATIALAAVAAASPGERLLYSDAHGHSTLLAAIQGPAPLVTMLPTFTEENWRTPFALLMQWTAVALIGLVSAGALARARAFRTPSSFILGFGVLTLVASAFASATTSAAARAASARQGQIALLSAYDPSRFHAVDASRTARLDDAGLRALLTVEADTADEAGIAPLVRLPEGTYDAQMWFAGIVPAVQLVAPGGGMMGAAEAPSNPAQIRFDMPISGAVGPQWRGAGAALRQVRISPVAVVPASRRMVDGADLVESIGEGTVRGLLAYADNRSYPEGGVYWTRGTERATTVVVSSNAAGLKLVLHVGPTGGPVELRMGPQQMLIDLQPNETREITVELGRVPARTPVSVKASRAFVPAAYDSANTDRRSLGCQVRPVLF